VPQLHALLVLLLVGSGGAWVMQSVRVQSEMPFACMLLLFVLEAERERPRRARLLLWAALAFALRSVGVVPLLLAPFVGVQRADERVDGLPGDRRSISGRAAGMRWRPHVPSLVLSLGLLGAWLLYGQLAASGTWGYGEEFVARSGGFAQLPGYLLEGLLFQLRSFALLIVDHPLADRHVWAALVLASPILLGMLRHLRERRPAEWVFVLSWGLILLAPARTSRYFVPMLPLLAVYFVDGLRVLAALLRRWRPMPKLRHVPSFAVALLLIVHLLALAPILERRHRALVIDAPPLQRQALGGAPSRAVGGGLAAASGRGRPTLCDGLRQLPARAARRATAAPGRGRPGAPQAAARGVAERAPLRPDAGSNGSRRVAGRAAEARRDAHPRWRALRLDAPHPRREPPSARARARAPSPWSAALALAGPGAPGRPALADRSRNRGSPRISFLVPSPSEVFNGRLRLCPRLRWGNRRFLSLDSAR
jgi:hypothetical protein